MKRVIMSLASIGALALGISAASAADMPAKAPMYAPPAPVANWNGFYVGIHGGFGGDQFEYPFSIGPIGGLSVDGSATLKSSGFFGGGQVGYNWQFAPRWVAGIEADLSGSNIEDTAKISASVAGISLSADAGTKLDYFGTVRGRIGLLVTPSALLYGTGGWAYGKTTTSLNASATGLGSFSASSSHNKSGWAAGAGLEYAFNNWLSFKTEYLYIDLGTDNVASGTLLGVLPYSIDEKTTIHTIKVGLNARFNGF